MDLAQPAINQWFNFLNDKKLYFCDYKNISAIVNTGRKAYKEHNTARIFL